MLRIAAFASDVVPSIATVRPFSGPSQAKRSWTHVNTAPRSELVQSLVERMPRTRRQFARRDPHRLLPFLAFGHGHATQSTVRLVPREVLRTGALRGFHHGLLGLMS